MFGAFSENQLIGLLAMRGEGHIALFFVKNEFQRQGFGRKLFEFALQNNSAEKITVHSSPYATEIYHRLGFNDITPEQT
ncbi:MAG: GNAT family N-acetyltransferase [Eubacteriales bacterium]